MSSPISHNKSSSDYFNEYIFFLETNTLTDEKMTEVSRDIIRSFEEITAFLKNRTGDLTCLSNKKINFNDLTSDDIERLTHIATLLIAKKPIVEVVKRSQTLLDNDSQILSSIDPVKTKVDSLLSFIDNEIETNETKIKEIKPKIEELKEEIEKNDRKLSTSVIVGTIAGITIFPMGFGITGLFVGGIITLGAAISILAVSAIVGLASFIIGSRYGDKLDKLSTEMKSLTESFSKLKKELVELNNERNDAAFLNFLTHFASIDNKDIPPNEIMSIMRKVYSRFTSRSKAGPNSPPKYELIKNMSEEDKNLCADYIKGAYSKYLLK